MLLTFRRGSGLIGLGTVVVGLLSGVYFPLTLLPDWLDGIANMNPVAQAINGMRDALLGGAGFVDIASNLAFVLPFSAASLAVGLGVFRLAVRRERRRGTLGLY
jgi:ABC-2 type transport system permease protein